MKGSKFQFAMLILIVVMICAMSIVCIDILRIKGTLDRLYCLAEKGSRVVGVAIEIYESKLNQSLAIMSVGSVVLATAVILLLWKRAKSGKWGNENERV